MFDSMLFFTSVNKISFSNLKHLIDRIDNCSVHQITCQRSLSYISHTKHARKFHLKEHAGYGTKHELKNSCIIAQHC